MPELNVCETEEKHVILALDVLKVIVFSILTFHVFAFYVLCVIAPSNN